MSMSSVLAEVHFGGWARTGASNVGRPVTSAQGPDVQSALLAGLADHSGLGIAVCDPDGVLTMLNDTLEEMLGADAAEEALSTLADLPLLHDSHGRTVRPGRDPLSRALAGGKTSREVFTVADTSGRSGRALQCTAFPLLGPDATVLGAALVAVDVTASITQRRHLEVLREELVDTVNHEVRTPLAVIAGHMELIDDQPEPEALNWSLQAIGRAATQLGAVVASISEIAGGSLRAVPERD